MTKKTKLDAKDLAEAIIFRWYVLAQEDHDMLTRHGLDALEAAIVEILERAGERG